MVKTPNPASASVMRFAVAWMLGLSLLLPGCLSDTPSGQAGTNGGPDDPDQNTTLQAFSRDYELVFTGIYTHPDNRIGVERAMSNCVRIEDWKEADLRYLNITAMQAHGSVVSGWRLSVNHGGEEWQDVHVDGDLPLSIHLNETALPSGSEGFAVYAFAYHETARVAVNEQVDVAVEGAATFPERLNIDDAPNGACY